MSLSSIPQRIECLWCEDTVTLKSLNKHLHSHLQYFPERCGTCSFASHSRDLLTEHLFNSNHTVGNVANNEYLNLLIRQLTADAFQATKMGKDEFIRKKKEQPVANMPSSSPALATPHPAESRNGATSTNRRQSECSSNHSYSSPARTPRTDRRTTTSTNTDRSPEGLINIDIRASDGLRGDPHEKTGMEMLCDSMKTVGEKIKCKLCETRVDMDIVSRNAHVNQRHMPRGDPNDEAYGEKLQKKMRNAFPNLPYSKYQCIMCCDKERESDTSRYDHVAKVHMQQKLRCPIDGCLDFTSEAKFLYKHLETVHNVRCHRGKTDRLVGATRERFLKARDTFRKNLRELIDRCFPLLPPSSKQAMEEHEDGVDDDEDEDGMGVGEEERRANVAEMIRDAMHRSETNPMKRSYPSDSEDDYDDDEEEEVDDHDEADSEGNVEVLEQVTPTVPSAPKRKSIDIASTRNTVAAANRRRSDGSSTATSNEPPSSTVAKTGDPPAKFPSRLMSLNPHTTVAVANRRQSDGSSTSTSASNEPPSSTVARTGDPPAHFPGRPMKPAKVRLTFPTPEDRTVRGGRRGGRGRGSGGGI